MDTSFLKNQPVRTAMTTHVVCVHINDILSEAAQIMQDHDFHHLPVVEDGGRLAGMLSKSDLLLLMDWGSNRGLESAAVKNKNLLNSLTVEDVMTPNVVAVRPNHSLAFCAGIFNENLFRALPVVEDGQLVGIITTYDLIKQAYL